MFKIFSKKERLFNKIKKTLKNNKDYLTTRTNYFNNFLLEIGETTYRNYMEGNKICKIQKTDHSENAKPILKKLSEMDINELEDFYEILNETINYHR